MPEYDGLLFEPPAPIASVSFFNPEKNLRIENVLMLIDTGADVTLLPYHAVENLGLDIGSSIYYETIGFDGNSSQSRAVKLEMLFLDKKFRGQFLLIEQEYGIIGRNILNSLTLTFIGKKLFWREDP